MVMVIIVTDEENFVRNRPFDMKFEYHSSVIY
jgi:hypothetical protein